MNRNEYIEAELVTGRKVLIKKDSIISIYDIKVPIESSPETEVTLANGRHAHLSEDYSKFCDRLFAL